MGILNVTPDSFSDGGIHFEFSRAIAHGARLREEGADVVDVGGESTRPGARPVAIDVELARVIPVVARLVREGVPVSIDTMKPEVMRAAVDAGACLVNDVNAFRAPGAIEALAATRAGACVMHMQGTPITMQAAPRYEGVVAEVSAFLAGRGAARGAPGPARPRSRPRASRATASSSIPGSDSARRSSTTSRCCVACPASPRSATRCSRGSRASA